MGLASESCLSRSIPSCVAFRNTRSSKERPSSTRRYRFRKGIASTLYRRCLNFTEGESSNGPAPDLGFKAQYPPLETQRFRMDSEEGRELIIETGAIGRQANGAVLARQGDTVIYTTVCCKKEAPITDFVPLTVDYVEKLSSVGRTAQGFIKREKQRDHEILTSRIVDRSIRPLFPEGWSKETQLLETVMSFDGVNSTEPLAITAAGAALALSDLPVEHPIVGVRVGWIDKPVINPTIEEQEQSKLDLIISGTVDGIIMIEASAEFIKEKDLLTALQLGVNYVMETSEQLGNWVRSIRKEKSEDGIDRVPNELTDAVFAFCQEELEKIFSQTSKKDRNVDRDILWKKIKDVFGAQSDHPAEYGEHFISRAYKKCESLFLREKMMKTGRRIDGRNATDIRPIFSSANILPRTHGSSLFTRGNTQAICVATLGSQTSAQKIETIQEEDLQRFYLQYFFPPSSVGEVRRFTLYPGRRELGHGQLASWALAPSVPGVKKFPYTIRLESTITESDGSSSMASVCGGYLAMMDAGVPMTTPIAGIAMGLMLNEADGSFIVLSDIMGTEDALGDMDLKVAGSVDAVTAIQMDVKVAGVRLDILSTALRQAKDGRAHILQEMRKCDPATRNDISPYAPHIRICQIDPSKNGRVIGAGGQNIRALEEQSGVESINVDDSGEIEIIGTSYESIQKAEEMMKLMIGELRKGQILKNVKVSGIKQFGVFVDYAPGRTGLVHVSELALTPVKNIEEVVSMGDVMDVEVLSTTSDGKCSLSRRAILRKQLSQNAPPSPPVQEKPMRKEATPVNQ